MLLHGLERNTVLQQLNLLGNAFDDSGAESLAAHCKASATLRTMCGLIHQASLELPNLKLSHADMLLLAPELERNRHLVHVNLLNNEFEARSGQLLVAALRANQGCALQRLDVSVDEFGAEAAHQIAEAMHLPPLPSFLPDGHSGPFCMPGTGSSFRGAQCRLPKGRGQGRSGTIHGLPHRRPMGLQPKS